MWANLNQKKLYVLVLFAGTFLFMTALGGGLFNQTGFWFEHWQHKAFRGLCHQDPQRSFWIGGTPMPVCSRCLGIYAGFLFSWLSLPLAGSPVQYFNNYRGKLLAGVILLNIIDVIGNFLGLWQNTLISRFAMGTLVGVSSTLVIGYNFIEKTQLNIKGIHYGTDRTR